MTPSNHSVQLHSASSYDNNEAADSLTVPQLLGLLYD